MTEHTPVYPKIEKWQCSCGMVNDYVTYTCVKCGKTQVMAIYSDPCDRCGLCKKPGVQIDWLVRDNVLY